MIKLGSTEDLISVTDLQRTPGRILKQVRESDTPLYLTQRGRVTALLINPKAYEQLLKPQGGSQQTGHQGRRQVLLRELEAMLPILIDRYQPEKIILFGSLAEGTVGEASDIDLVVIKKTDKRPLERRKELLRLVHPRVATDFFVYTPEEFQTARKKGALILKEVEEKGKVLYEKAA